LPTVDLDQVQKLKKPGGVKTAGLFLGYELVDHAAHPKGLVFGVGTI
jgi:hypothetical protein